MKRDELCDILVLYQHTFSKSCEILRKRGVVVKGALVQKLGRFQHFEIALNELIVEIDQDLGSAMNLVGAEHLEENLDILIENASAMLLQVEAFYMSL